MRSGVITRLFHRRLWNILLLITFLVTAILGLLLTVQINYKLEWPVINTLLKLHVDFGIGMSLVALFHLLWNWNYYKNIINSAKKKKKAVETKEPEFSGEPVSHYLILLSGFLLIIIQVLLIREITTVFQGNEILMVWTLGIWMLLNSAGVWLGTRLKWSPSKEIITRIILFFSILPVLLVVALNLLRNVIFPSGVLIHPLFFFLAVSVMLLPVCLLTGINFTLFIYNLYGTRDGYIRVYSLEALGCLFGGFISSFVLFQWFTITQSLLLISLILMVSLYILNRKTGYLTGIVFMAALLFITFFFHTDRLIKSRLFINQKIVETKETYYGNITVTEKAGQFNFYENGSLLFTSYNNIVSEEYVHFAMLQHKNPERVLLVSGGVSGMLSELIKYQEVESIEYVELNPELVRMAEKYFPFPDDKRIHVVFNDIRKYLLTSSSTFDVAVIALPDPSSLQINRIFTREFMDILKKRMNSGGVVIYGLSPSGNYLSDFQKYSAAIMYNTLHTCFGNVIIVPGERDYFIASDSTMSPAIGELWMENTLDNLYVNSYYIDDYGIRERGDFIRNEISGISLVNTDNKPLPVFYNVLSYLAHFSFPKEILWAIIAILTIIPLFFMRPVTSGVYIAGFSGVTAEILLLFVFQILYGYVYSIIGLIIAFFMGGLVLGAYLGGRLTFKAFHFRLAQVSMVLYFLIFPLLTSFNPVGASFITWLLFVLAVVIPSALIGYIYVTATRLLPGDDSQTAPYVYAADVLGAAIGVVIISVILIPLLGIRNSCVFIAGMNGLAIVWGLMGYRKRIIA